MKNGQPWSLLAGLLATSLVILIGVFRGLEPDVVLLRAAVSGVGVGVLTAVCRFAWVRL